jgi:GNAT superfamily N-acetyltransferase
MITIRTLLDTDLGAALTIVNEAAQAYRGVIPADQWRDPYMSEDKFREAIADDTLFWVAEDDGRLLAVMGIQDKREVALVRHAYVRPALQRHGVGTMLLRHVTALTDKPVLIGTWAAAVWAIEFYQRNGFVIVPLVQKELLLRRYWSISARQIETSVVLGDRRWTETQHGAPVDR